AEDLDPAAERRRLRSSGIAEIEPVLVYGVERAGRQRGRGAVRARPDVCRENEDGDGTRTHDLLHRLEAGHPGKLDVHRHQVRAQLRDRVDGPFGRPEHAYDLDVSVVLERAAKRFRVGAGVLADEDSPLSAFGVLVQEPTSCPMVSSSACWSK